jgi:hypothetical protein
MTDSTTPGTNDVTTNLNNAATNNLNELRMTANLDNDQTNDNDLNELRIL